MKKQALLLLIISIIFSGCNHYYYVSSIQNVPLFKERNEFHLAGSYAKGDESESAEAQSAYSITNHLGIMANYQKTRIGSYEEHDYMTGKNYDFGIGYFRPIGKDAVFEVYSGFGRNKQHHTYSTLGYNPNTGNDEYFSDGDAYLKYNRYYIQPSFGFAFDYFDVAASVRLSQLRYNYVDFDVVSHDEDIRILNMLPKKSHFMLEPAITLRSGWRQFKFQFQASYVEYLNDSGGEGEQLIDFVEEPHVSFGMYLTLAGRWKPGKSN